MSNRTKAKRQSSTFSLIAWAKVIEKSLLALLVFLVPLALYYGNTSYNHYKMVVFIIGLAVLYGLWGVRHWFEGSTTVRFSKLLWAGLGLLVALGVSLVSVSNLQIGLQNMAILTSFILFYFYLTNHIKQPSEIYSFLLMGVIASAIAAGYGWLQYEAILPGNPKYPNGGSLSILSSFGNLNFMAEYMGIWMLAGVFLVFRMKTFIAKILVGGALVGILLMMITADTLGVLVSLGIGTVVIVLAAVLLKMLRLPKRINAALIIVLISSALLTGGWMMQQNTASSTVDQISQLKLLQFPWSSLQALAERYEEATSVSARLLDWTLALKMLVDEPLFGVGTGHYGIEFYNYKEQLAQTPLGSAFDFYVAATPHAHNDYLEFIAETGVIGAFAIIAFLAVMVWGFATQLRHESNRHKRWLILVLQVSILTICIDAGVNFPFHLPASGLGFVLLLGILDSVCLNGRVKSQQLSPILTKGFSGIGIVMAAVMVVLTSLDWQADMHFERGHQHALAQRYQMALGEFERSLDLDIAPAEVFFRLGGLHFQFGDFDQAETFYMRSLDAFLIEDTYWNLASVNAQQGDIEVTKTYLDRLESLRPRDELLERVVDLRRQIAEFEANQ